MRCPNCTKRTLKRQKGLYPYKESGLSNVYLENVTWYKCSECNATEAEIPRTGQLHRCMAWRIVTKQTLLSGEEVVFLRKMLGLSQQEFAKALGVNQVVLSRWETGARRKHSLANDRVIRLVYLLSKDDEYTREIHYKLRAALVKLFSQIKDKVSTPKVSINPNECTSEKEIQNTLAFCTAVSKQQEANA